MSYILAEHRVFPDIDKEDLLCKIWKGKFFYRRTIVIIDAVSGKILLICFGAFLTIAGVANAYKASKLRNWALTGSILLAVIVLGAIKHGVTFTTF